MNGDREVLASNLELLLRRSYEPVAIRPEFRHELERRVLASVRASAPERRRAPARTWHRSPLVRVALAASIAVLVFFLARELPSSSSTPPGAALGEILARGDVAWRDGRGEPWSPAPAGARTGRRSRRRDPRDPGPVATYRAS